MNTWRQTKRHHTWSFRRSMYLCVCVCALQTVCLYFAGNDRPKIYIFSFLLISFDFCQVRLSGRNRTKNIVPFFFYYNDGAKELKRSNLKSRIFSLKSRSFLSFSVQHFRIDLLLFYVVFISPYTLLAASLDLHYLLRALIRPLSVSLATRTVHVYFNIESQFLRISTEIALSWSSNKMQHLLLVNVKHRPMRCPIEVKWKWFMSAHQRKWSVGQNRKRKKTKFRSHYHLSQDDSVVILQFGFLCFWREKRFRFQHITSTRQTYYFVFFSIY